MLCKVMFTKGDEVMYSVKKKKACKKAVWFEIVFNLLVLNVEHLLKLSDEYEINHVFESCLSFLKKQPKLKQNVMKLRKMAAMYNLKGVLDGCEDFLKNMKLKTLREIVDFKDLDKETLQHFLEQRIERLEEFVDQVYPEYMGVLEYAMEKRQYDTCKEHISKGKFNHNRTIDSEVIRGSGKCRQQIVSSFTMETSSYQRKYRHKERTSYSSFSFGSCSIDDIYALKNG